MSARTIHEDQGARTSEPDSSIRPTRIGSCDVHAELASGGTATVFIGVHHGSEGFEKVVAVKRLLPAFALDTDYHAMLADEAAVSARADHPYVRHVFDFGVDQEGSPYAVMEFLFGQPLAAVFRGLTDTPDFARDRRHTPVVVRIIANLCEGLHAVHELSDDSVPLDIVHRDVTPHNLFVLYDGSVRVTDFGIVRARVRRQAPSGAALKGKVPYMSPEYLSRKPYDRRADVWAIGVVLWELLTGSRLFRKGSDPETVRAILSAPVPRPSRYGGDGDKRLDEIVLRALNRNVELRYHTAQDLATDLEDWLSRCAHPVTTGEMGRWLDQILPGSRASLAQLVRDTRASLRGVVASERVERPTKPEIPSAVLHSRPPPPLPPPASSPTSSAVVPVSSEADEEDDVPLPLSRRRLTGLMPAPERALGRTSPVIAR